LSREEEEEDLPRSKAGVRHGVTRREEREEREEERKRRKRLRKIWSLKN